MIRRCLRIVRRAFFPRLEEIVAEKFAVPLQDTGEFIVGRRNLGTGFYTPNAGFSEDTWPIIIVGQFLPEYIGDTAWYDLRRFRRRLVLNAEEKWGLVQIALMRRHVKRSAVAEICRGLAEIQAYVQDGYLTQSLNVNTIGRVRQKLRIEIDAHPLFLQVLAARINFLWIHGRESTQYKSPEWRHDEDMKWHNPDNALLEDLRSLRPHGSEL